MVPTHEVFHKPFKVNIQLEEQPTPDDYRHWPGGDQLGKTMKMWKVQTKKYPEIDPGLVSDPYGFGDSPDAEVISSGQNSKGPEAVAIGRHGNFFLWGFSAQPSDMTPEARKCFLNSICYIKKYDGQKPLVTKTSSGRRWALAYAGFGKDPEKDIRYYQENLEYLHQVDGRLVVDEDVKGLGLSNRKLELLERCISLLEKGEQHDLAMRILERYTRETFTNAKAWRAWLEKNREQLFFTDTGGYKFLIGPASGTRQAAAAAVRP